jgi:hypothetical protein
LGRRVRRGHALATVPPTRALPRRLANASVVVILTWVAVSVQPNARRAFWRVPTVAALAASQASATILRPARCEPKQDWVRMRLRALPGSAFVGGRRLRRGSAASIADVSAEASACHLALFRPRSAETSARYQTADNELDVPRGTGAGELEVGHGSTARGGRGPYRRPGPRAPAAGDRRPARFMP